MSRRSLIREAERLLRIVEGIDPSSRKKPSHTSKLLGDIDTLIEAIPNSKLESQFNFIQSHLRQISAARHVPLETYLISSGSAHLRSLLFSVKEVLEAPEALDDYFTDAKLAPRPETFDDETGQLAADEYNELMASVAVLEATLHQFQSRTIGIGHNHPPEPLDEPACPVSDDDITDIERLIALLKEQPPAPLDLPVEVVNQSKKVSKIGEKLSEYCDTFAAAMFKSAGTAAGKRLIEAPFWLALAAAISKVSSALVPWLNTIAH
ncbi:MAG: hypothetical protein PS018_21185 [bacterium]|nr:hypothetical protein [bacterium]